MIYFQLSLINRSKHKTLKYYYRYDPIGVGKSTINIATLQFEDWLTSALAMVDNVCDKDIPIIIVSSSVGSWVGSRN